MRLHRYEASAWEVRSWCTVSISRGRELNWAVSSVRLALDGALPPAPSLRYGHVSAPGLLGYISSEPL